MALYLNKFKFLAEYNFNFIEDVPADVELLVRGPLHHVVDAVPGEQGRRDALKTGKPW